ncbi:MAG: DUF4270 family protein [Chitinophagales bacterium]
MARTITGGLVIIIVFSVLLQSCYRNDIGFGNLPDNNYTNVVFTDTVEAVLSTVVLDSFVTNGASSFLLGKYKDPYLGIVSARPFFQMTIPSSESIPTTAQYDSIDFIIHLNKYYYGDTSRAQTIFINELADFINYSYSTNLYNTSNFSVKPTPLGSQTFKIRPSVDDSILIRMDDAKGTELFDKLQQQDNDIINDDNFQNYFKGVSLSVGENDTTAVYGLNGSANNMVMRIFYHTTTPYLQSQSVDFTLKGGTYSFNQIITDRTGTSLYPATPGIKEFPSEQTNNLAFTQYGAGVLLKITFPSLKGIIATDKLVELQKAELMVRPVAAGFDFNKFKLPDNLSLAQTDGTNTVGSYAVNNVPPVTDEIYGLDTYYKFDVTSYINTLLTTAGGEDKGFFLIENNASPNVTRAVIGNNRQSVYRTQLLVTAIIINK